MQLFNNFLCWVRVRSLWASVYCEFKASNSLALITIKFAI